MNYYIIRSTEPEEFLLDTDKLKFPAQVTDLRVGKVYVLETRTSEKIYIGGSVPIQAIIYYDELLDVSYSVAEFDAEASGGYQFQDGFLASHIGFALVDPDVDVDDSVALLAAVPLTSFKLIRTDPNAAVDITAPQPT